MDQPPRAHCRSCCRPLYFSERLNREELCRQCAADAGLVRIADARWLRLQREEHRARVAFLVERAVRGEVEILRPGDMPSDPALVYLVAYPVYLVAYPDPEPHSEPTGDDAA
jgi:hypothetical protein